MALNFNPIIVFDLETTGKDAKTVEIVEIAAKAYNPRTLEPYDNGEFLSLVKPITPIEELPAEADEAFKITGIDKKELENAPEAKTVWKEFVAYVNKFNKKKDEWNSPVAAGSNIKKYDLILVERYNELFGPKKKETLLFNTFKGIDLMELMFYWFENSSDLVNYKNETLRQYFGWADIHGAHRAMNDVMFTAALIFRFMNFHRSTGSRTRFRDCFKK